MYELNVVGHVLFSRLRLPEPSSWCFHLLKEHAHIELFFNDNDRCSIDLNAFEFFDITTIGETFIFVGKSPLKFL